MEAWEESQAETAGVHFRPLWSACWQLLALWSGTLAPLQREAGAQPWQQHGEESPLLSRPIPGSGPLVTAVSVVNKGMHMRPEFKSLFPVRRALAPHNQDITNVVVELEHESRKASVAELNKPQMCSLIIC